MSKFAHGVVPPREANSIGALGEPVAGRPELLATSGRVYGFVCHSKTPPDPTRMVLSSVSVNCAPA